MQPENTAKTRAAQERLLSALRHQCAGLPGSEEYIMVHHPAFRVGKRPSLIVGFEEASRGPTLSINLGRDAQDSLLSDPRFVKTPYIGQHGWVTIAYKQLSEDEMRTLVVDSWRRVATRRLLAELAGKPQASARPAKKRRPADTKRRTGPRSR
jgi:predicted DNA-binding protein (MmcQ/YjbR family)